ncbi:Ig-like domain-containing protein [Sulfuricurvum sp.]|uniref:Ig-like domain-containing protein n=1 Tax=Sulfuricurvum sp. TaxID=2025608 RepID=UPI00286E855E|nr:Ig-like domain-containing protein [Sulfuricurvum sp.]
MADTTTLIDGVTTIPVSTGIDTYMTAIRLVEQMSLPKLYDTSNINSRVFLALADGTENNINDPAMGAATNIGILSRQLETINATNSNIGFFYEEGPGTQGGLNGGLDSGFGFSYDERAEILYKEFCYQAKDWLIENPNAEISLGELGFSRGSAVIAKFNQLVHERGIVDPDSTVISIDMSSGDPTQWKQITTYDKVLQQPGTIAQSVILYDPVVTGISSDLSLSSSTISALQITAANEYRTLFPSMSLVTPGMSEDGRYLNVTVTGAHSDIGGGYYVDGLPALNFNMTASVLNTMLGQNIIQPLTLPTDEGMYVIHNSVEGEWFYTKTLNREIKYSDFMAGDGTFGVDSELASLYRYGTMIKEEPNTILGLSIDLQKQINAIIAPITSGISNLIDGVSTYGPSIIDALSLIKAIQSGEPLPIVTSGLRLANDLTHGSSTILSGASSVASGVLSIMSLDAALKSGDTLAAISATVNSINFAASAYASFAGATSGLSYEIGQQLMGSGIDHMGTNALGLTDGALPYLNLVLAIQSGDEVGIAVAAVSLIPGMQWVGIAYGVYSMISGLFGGDDIPDPWGTGRYVWNGNGITYQSAGETGGNEAVSGVMQSVITAMNSLIEQQRLTNPTSALGIIPNRMPSVAYDMSGYRYTDIDPLTGVELHPSLRFDTSGNPYNATAGSPESYQSIGEAIIRSALSRSAIAPMWEVNTAKIQTDAGDPKAGLTEEARAGRDGQLAGEITGDTQTFRPVALDLSGNGMIDTLSKAASGVSFDVDDSGYLKQTGWVGSGDAFLTLDRDYNGETNSGQEMFSNSTVALGRRGLAGMGWVDANYDGKITAADPVWNELRVWQDANSDGVEAEAESLTLDELGITELNYAMGTFTQNGVKKLLSSPDLEADTTGVKVNVVPEGILIDSSTDGLSLLVTRIDDMTAVEANQDGISGYEDVEMIVSGTDLLANDTLGGFTGRDLELTGVSNFRHGSGFVDANGFVHFRPEANYFGSDAGFDYTTTATANGQSGTGHVAVTLQGINDAPSGANIVYGRNGAGMQTGSGSVIGIDIDNSAASLTYQIVGNPQYGGVSMTSNGTFQYTAWSSPNVPVDYYDEYSPTLTDAFDVKVTDPSGASYTKTVYVDHYGDYTPPTPPGGGGGKKPIAVDLNGDGFEFVSVDDSNVFFDVTGDGWKRRTAWVSESDGLLAFDSDGNGKIEKASEISFVGYKEGAQSDLEGLNAFDTNGDGVFNASDAQWDKFGIWQDTNQNGITDDGEFKTLSEMGVASVGLTSDGLFSVVNEQTLHGIGSMQMGDGSAMAIADVTLEYTNETQVHNSEGTTSSVVASPFSPDGEEINGTEDKDLILGKNGNNIINAFGGDDVIFEDGGNDVIDAGEGNDIVYAGADNDIVFAQGGDDLVYGGLGDDMIFGGDGHDAIFADGGNDVVFAGSGNDMVTGGYGNDVISGDEGNDMLYGEGGNDALFGRDGNDELFGTEGYDLLNGGAGDDLLDGGSEADEMVGGTGDDTYVVDNTADIVTEVANEGNDTVIASIDYTLAATLENLTLSGDAINGTGNDADNRLIGNANNNRLEAKGGNDTLNGGIGADTMIGGSGDDLYIVDNVSDVVIENATEGTDTVRASVSYTLSDNIEHLTLTGSASINATGNALDNTLIGNSGNNILDAKEGADTMIGGKGDDLYVVDSTEDIVTEYAGEGVDTVRSSVTRTLEDTIENLVLSGSNAIDGTGNAMSNILIGNDAANTLDAKAGSDAMAGYGGDDTYIVDNVGDTVYESVDAGDDHVIASVTYTLSDNVERLTLVGTDAIDATGNNLDNVLIGNSADNVLDGKAGADRMSADAGNDIYVVDNIGDIAVETADNGIDTIISSVSYVLPEHVENITLSGSDNISATGNELNNVIIGNSVNNVLDGKAGMDTMSGGAGDDTYYVDTIGDTVLENIAEGIDTIKTTVTYTASANVERLELIGTDNIDGYGNELDNTLIGNSGNNRLDGQSGMDAMSGGAGDDTYIVDNIGDTVTEGLNEGDDHVISSVTYTLSDNVERLTLVGTETIDGTGNVLDNTLIGNSANNILDGKEGIDTMIGGDGDDNYYVDAENDTVFENVSEGLDTIYSTVSYVLPENVENLILIGDGNINAGGNGLDNTLIGNGSNNTISGGAGKDLLDGKAGNDTLEGGIGNDTLIGGLGNDTFIINMSDDLDMISDEAGEDTVHFTEGFSLDNVALRVVDTDGVLSAQVRVLNAGGCEQADQGFDFVITKDTKGNYVSPIEHFMFSDGSSKTFDDLLIKTQVTYASHRQTTITTGRNDDIIYGNSRNNIIYSGTGNDIVYAGSGGDKIYAQGGNDTVSGSTGNDMLDGGCGIDILSGSNGEDTLVDTLGNNALLGGSHDDVITAGEGNDFIAGGYHNDILNGGAGYNVFAFNKGDGRDTILPSAGAHNTLSLNDVDYRDISLRKNGADLIVDIGCNSQVTLKSWYGGEANQNFDTLQIVSSEYDYDFGRHGWSVEETPHIETFDFKALVDAFDAAKASNPRLNAWNAMNTMLQEHLNTSDSMALGGDLAFAYAKEGDLFRMSIGAAQDTLSSPAFGIAAQLLTPEQNNLCHH